MYPCLFSITWYLAFLAADWSRTVSTSPLQLFYCCPLVLETFPSSFGLSPIGTEGVTLLASPAFPVDLPSTLSAVALRLFVFLSCFVGASVSPYCLGLFSPRCCFCPVTGPGGLLPSSPSGLCPLFVSVPLGCCAWSFWPQTGPDFQRHPLFFLSFHLLFPSLSCFFLLTSAPVSSKSVTGTQSLSIRAKLMAGKRKTHASSMYVPAHVGCTLSSPVSADMGTSRDSNHHRQSVSAGKLLRPVDRTD